MKISIWNLGTGLQWSMFNEPVSVDDNFSMADVVLVLYIDAFIYLILALYIENIWPGQYGIPKYDLIDRIKERELSFKKFRGIFYPFKPSYWCGPSRRSGNRVVEANEGYLPNSVNSDAFEDEPTNRKLGLQLNNVSKVNNTIKYSYLFSISYIFYFRLTHFFSTVVHLSMLYVILV